MRRIVAVVTLIALSLVTAALAKERIDVTVSYPVAPERPLPPGLQAVAVLDAGVRATENSDEREHKWSLIAADMIESMLLAARDRFGSPLAVADRRNMQLVLQEHDLRAAGLVAAPTAAQVGQLLAVQGIITTSIDIEVSVERQVTSSVDWPMVFTGLIQGVAGGPGVYAPPPPPQPVIVETAPVEEGREGDRRAPSGAPIRSNRGRDNDRHRDDRDHNRRYVSRVRTVHSQRVRQLYRTPYAGLPSGGVVVTGHAPAYQPKGHYAPAPAYVPPTAQNSAGIHGPGSYVEPGHQPAGVYYPPGSYPPPVAPPPSNAVVVAPQPVYPANGPITYVAPAFGTREVEEISRHLSVQCSFALIDAVTGQTIMRFAPPPYRKTDRSSPTFLYGGVANEAELNPIDHFIGELVERASQEFVSMLAPVEVAQTYTITGRGDDGEQAVRALRADDYAGAVDLFIRQAHHDDDKPECAFAAGIACAMVGRFDEAMQYLRNAAGSRKADGDEVGMYQQAAHRLSTDLPRIMRPADSNAQMRYGEVIVANENDHRSND